MFKVCGVFLLLFFSALVNSEELQISVVNITEVKGALIVAVFDKPDYWLDAKPKEEPFRRAVHVLESTDDAVIVIDGVPAGNYAISVFHDANDNEKLDTNFIGFPKEPFGFSAPMGKFGPPKFEAASINVGPESSKITIELN